ncbi:hypothetical protein ANO11243_035740 [Dothideomycetidae sp. 11243]|nr:hypothetical protein ANO11243_035740 [fungal sp. No.11243]
MLHHACPAKPHLPQESVTMAWEGLAASKRQALADSIPEEWRIQSSDEISAKSLINVTEWQPRPEYFSPLELEITSSTAAQLLTCIRSGTWSSEQVIRAFCKRAAVGHQLLNCLSETMFHPALERARTLDEHLRRTGKPIGPLHGLPISLKDCFNVAGKDSTVGFAHWIDKPAERNSTLVDLLITLGAVPYLKTNVPTAMMIAETVNNVFGRTLNPLNRQLTPGGSSGGESALIAYGGSCLGVGTDIGGSLRIPASCTGIFTLRPSFGRFPTGGAASGLAGQEAINSVNGPMARTLNDIKLFARVVVGAEPWRVDPKCVPIPWRDITLPKKLKIGVLWHDDVSRPTPPVQRALKHTAERLRKSGHEIVDWPPDLHKELLDIMRAFFLVDGGKTIQAILDPVGEPWRPEMNDYKVTEERGVSELWRMQANRTRVVTAYLQRIREAGLGAILCPTTPYACTSHTKFKYVGYTGVFNVLDYSALSFPTGLTVDTTLDVASKGQPILSAWDEEAQNDYDAEVIRNMPISLQLVAGRLEEEKVIAMAREVLHALRHEERAAT